MGIFKFNEEIASLQKQNGEIEHEGTNSKSLPSCCRLITANNNEQYRDMIVPEEFERRIAVHVFSLFSELNKTVVPPLYLAIEGAPGEGKTSQTLAVLLKFGIDAIYVSASDISGAHERESVDVLNSILEYANHLRDDDKLVSIVIDDFHMGIITQDQAVKKTINTNLLTGKMMNLADCSETKRVPIILTGNDFSTVYAPLLRAGRADLFEWNPTGETKKQIVTQILSTFVDINEDDVEHFFNRYQNRSISDFAQLKNDYRKKYIWKIVQQNSRDSRSILNKLKENALHICRINYNELCELAVHRFHTA